MREANEQTLVIAQIETVRGIEDVEGIASVEGIDVLWIGHMDLTTSLGITGQFDHPDYNRALRRLLEACEKTGRAPGGSGATPRPTAQNSSPRDSAAWPASTTS